VDTFDDQLEGRKPEEASNSPGEAAFFETYNIERWGEQYPGAHDEQRGCFFANCWHMNPKENARMWHEYTKGCRNSVALVTSVKRLRRGLRNCGRQFRLSPVKYLDRSDPRPQFLRDAIFFYKDRERFSHEREFRILTELLNSEVPFYVSHPESKRRLVPFNFNVGVRRLVFHPDASSVFKREMRQKFRPTFGSVRQIEDSSL
jgi:hypothetical protein